MNRTLFKQHDTRWRSLPYPTKKCNVGHAGCGLVACIHIAIEQASKWNWTPKTLRAYMVKKGYAVAGHGTTWQGITNTLKYLGHKKVVWVKKNEPMSKAWAELDKGNRIGIILFNSNKAPNGTRWTSGGHYVAFVGYRKSGDKHIFYTKDSGGRNHTGNYSYENSMRNCISQMWIVERINAPKPYVITKPYSGKLPSKVVKKGSRGADVKAVQNFLNWCINSKLAVDGKCGSKTTSAIKKYQKQYKLKVDGIFGSQSKKKAQEIIKAHAPKPAPTPTPKPVTTGADKIVAKAKDYAWPYATEKRKYAYKTGAPKSAYKTALKKYMKKTAKVSQSDCGYFVSTCVRASGVAPKFLALAGLKDPFPSVPSTMKVVHKGKKIPDGLLQPGDVIRYKKTNGHQHTLLCYSKGKIAEACRSHWFPAIKKDTKKYNNSNVKLSTLQVIRAK